MPGTTISRGFAAFVLSAAFAASHVSAQTASDPSPAIYPRQADQVADGSRTGAPSQPEAQSSHAPTVVSVDLLLHPITAKVRKLLLRAIETMETGDHETAIGQLQETLMKYPESAAYVHNLLGVEYVRTDRFQAAIGSFEKAVRLLPHDAMTHYNFGLALVCAGDYDRAGQEVRRALELDPKNPQMQMRLDSILEHRRSGN